MPNRILREGILTSERIERLDWAEEVFYRRVMSVVDDYGRYYARPALLRRIWLALHGACRSEIFASVGHIAPQNPCSEDDYTRRSPPPHARNTPLSRSWRSSRRSRTGTSIAC